MVPVFFLTALLSSSSAEEENTVCPAGSSSAADGTCTDHDVVNCGVYMAPSTVGDHSNLGIYTAKPMKDGDIVPYPEIIIPLLWRIFGDHPAKSFTDGELWDRYIWEQQVGGIEAFEDLDRSKEKVACFIPGVGCTVNSMLELGNIESANGSEFDEVVNRSSPGAGAFTPYHSSPTTINSPDGFEHGVEAGQELFATYGDEWIPYIPDVAVTFHRNFAKADELMGEFEDWILEHEGRDSESTESEVSDELLDDMWKMMVDFPHHGSEKWEVLSVLPKEWNRERLKELKHVKNQQNLLEDEDYGEDYDEDYDKEVSSSPLPNPSSTSTRYWADRGKISLEFLKENGKCQDHIRPDISKIPHAGRGAFATRNLPKGTIVGYAPLVHVAFRGEELFQVTYNGESEHGMERSEHRYEEDIDVGVEEEEMYSENRFTKQDLVVNYSFGHSNSTLHLTPYGAMVNYINHKSANDGNGPNVRVQWPTKELVAHKPDWISKDIEFLRDSINKIGLSFDYVALRDIQEGEEVTMDYGDEWDKAWKEHAANWVPPEDTEGYIHSSNFDTDYLRTPDEVEEEPYPWNLHTLCTDYYTKDFPSPHGDSYIYESSVVNDENKYRFPCEVLERFPEEDSYVYTVELQLSDTETIIARGFPNDENGVELYDKAYSQMWHMKEAFRNKMYIPDDIFPESWMTNKQ